MSLILDALNRADQERKEQNHIPTLQTVHGADEPERPPWWRRVHLERWLILLVVIYLAQDFVRDRAVEPVTGVVPETAPRAEAPAATSSAPSPQQSTSAPPKEQVSAPVDRDTGLTPKSPPGPAVKNRAVESLYSEPRSGAAAKTAQAASPTEASKPVAGASSADSDGRDIAFNLVEEVTDLERDFRRQIPTLKYSNHMPAAQPADSRVVLNATVYKEGDQLAPGLVLRQISKQGIVLEFQGTKFRLGAYNSWINFPGS